MDFSDAKQWFLELWSTSLKGVRANILPGMVLWIVGLVIVWIYYHVEEARDGFEGIMEFKVRYGFLYSGVATAVFGGLIPFLYLWWARRVPRGLAWQWCLFFVLYWAFRGIDVDALYRFQALLFGDDPVWQTILTKVLVDQFIYCPIWSAPMTAIFYGWRDSGFSWRKFRPNINRRLFLFEVPSVLLSIWIVWIPATAIIYSLPLPLQIPLFNLALCFFVLLISVLSPEKPRPGD